MNDDWWLGVSQRSGYTVQSFGLAQHHDHRDLADLAFIRIQAWVLIFRSRIACSFLPLRTVTEDKAEEVLTLHLT
jgi:hypothetical protein